MLRDEYGNPQVFIMVNGAAFGDRLGPGGAGDDGDELHLGSTLGTD
jgi:hypothetical protein